MQEVDGLVGYDIQSWLSDNYGAQVLHTVHAACRLETSHCTQLTYCTLQCNRMVVTYYTLPSQCDAALSALTHDTAPTHRVALTAWCWSA